MMIKEQYCLRTQITIVMIIGNCKPIFFLTFLSYKLMKSCIYNTFQKDDYKKYLHFNHISKNNT